MGLDLNRVSGKVDVEFLCGICMMVLQNAVQSPKCEHQFCEDCIKRWVGSNEICPVDRDPLNINELKPIARSLRNLLNKLEVKCAFVPNGCIAAIKLEHLQDHESQCLYNPNLEVACMAGCGNKMTQKEYESHNCISHLQNQIATIKEKFDMLLRRPQIWQYCKGITYSISEPNILVSTNAMGISIAQSMHSLKPENSYFEVKMLQISEIQTIGIGLTAEGCCVNEFPGNHEGSVGYNSFFGEIKVDRMIKHFVNSCQNGDVIRCGVKFPPNFTNNGNTGVLVYFTRNSNFVCEKLIAMPHNGFYPTIGMLGKGARVKYFDLLEL